MRITSHIAVIEHNIAEIRYALKRTDLDKEGLRDLITKLSGEQLPGENTLKLFEFFKYGKEQTVDTAKTK